MVWGTYRFRKHTTLQNGKKWPEKSAPECPVECGGGLIAIWAMPKWRGRQNLWVFPKGQVFHTATNQISSPKFIIRNLHCSPCLVCVDICIIMGCVCIYCLKCGTYRKWMAELRWRAAEAFTREPERELRLWSNVKYNVFFAFLFVQYSLKLHVTLPG